MSNKAAKIICGCGLERKVNELHNMMGWPRVVEYLTNTQLYYSL